MAITIQVSCSGWDATRVWVTWLEGDREKLVFTRSSSNRVAPVLISTLTLEQHLIWRTCDAALVAAMPYLDYFLLLFFLACSKLHFCNLLLQKIKFSGLKAKDVYHSHPYIKDIFWLLEQTHLWASVHISTHVAVIYPSRPNKRLIIFYEIDQIK